MTPYYTDDNCTIYNSNCDDVLPSLGRFDLLLTEAPQYPPGLTDDKKARMDSQRGLAGQSNQTGALPQAGLLMAIEMADNSIVWRTDRYALPSGKTLDVVTIVEICVPPVEFRPSHFSSRSITPIVLRQNHEISRRFNCLGKSRDVAVQFGRRFGAFAKRLSFGSH